MHFTAVVVGALATFASGVAALGEARINNNCPYAVYLTVNRPNVFGQPKSFAAKKSYHETYKGTGNSLGISKTADFYSPNTPKLIFGYSDQSPTVYYSVNNQDGTPSFGPNNSAGFTLVAGGGCKGSNGYNGGMTLTCNDANSVILTLCA